MIFNSEILFIFFIFGAGVVFNLKLASLFNPRFQSCNLNLRLLFRNKRYNDTFVNVLYREVPKHSKKQHIVFFKYEICFKKRHIFKPISYMQY